MVAKISVALVVLAALAATLATSPRTVRARHKGLPATHLLARRGKGASDCAMPGRAVRGTGHLPGR